MISSALFEDYTFYDTDLTYIYKSTSNFNLADCTPYSKGLTDNISSNLSITKSALKTISALNINLANYIKLWLQKEYKIIDQPLC